MADMEIKMARLETRMDEIVIPTLKRIEHKLSNLDDKLDRKTKENETRIVALELWKRDVSLATRTGISISKKAWAIIAGVVTLIYAIAKDWLKFGPR